MNKSFCVLPFYRTTIRANGNLAPCCIITNYANIKNLSLEEFWQSDQLENLRTNMLSGIECNECTECYNEERKFGKSMRTESWRDHSVNETTDLTKFVQSPKYLGRTFPNHLEYHLGNLCNLKCLTCNPRDSSAFLVENKILKISNHLQSDFNVEDHDVDQVIQSALEHRIEVLDLRGGESMLMPAVRKVLNNLPQNHGIDTLRIQTNCTVLDDFWKQIFTKFKTVEIMMSIDAYGAANEYIRYPSKWTDIEQNVDYFLSCNNVKLYVNCLISNLNFLVLPDIIEWCSKKNIYFHYSICSTPVYYTHNNLPEELFNKAKRQLDSYPNIIKLESLHNTQHWEDFCQMINKRDKHRGNSIFDILPELKPYWINK